MKKSIFSVAMALAAGVLVSCGTSAPKANLNGASKADSLSYAIGVTQTQGLKDYLVGEGYPAGILKNVEKNMFRVIIGSYDTKVEAAKAREAFKVKYPSRADFQGSWILYNK